MLREAFEESPELVDLSSENVPDINVITGESFTFFTFLIKKADGNLILREFK